MTVKLRRKAGETETAFAARQASQVGSDPKPEPEAAGVASADERISNLEKGLGNLMQGMNSIIDKLNTEPEVINVQEDKEPEKVAARHIPDTGPATINLGEIELRCDLAEFLQKRVKYLNDSGERPGWTIEREIEMMVKYTKRTSETSAAAADSRESTLSGAKK